MAKKGLNKSLHVSLPKLNWSPPQLPTPSSPGSFLSSCKHRRTRSIGGDLDRSGGGTATALSDAGHFVFKNFSSLYVGGEDVPPSGEPSPRYTEPPPDVIRASSQRFFVSPSTTGSLIEEARLSAASSSSSLRYSGAAGPAIPGGGVAVTTFSKDPYDEFWRSMLEMVEEWHVEPGLPLDWDFMEELLFCYLELNDRSVHKYILRAFSDLTVSFECVVRAGRVGSRQPRGGGGGGGGGGRGSSEESGKDIFVGYYSLKLEFL